MVNSKPWQVSTTSRNGWSSEIAKLCLIAGDFLVVALSFYLAERILQLPDKTTLAQLTPLFLAFLWPLIYWREGLYPGYGLSRPEKFQKYIIGALMAGWLLLLLKPFISADFHLTYPFLILGTALSVFIIYPLRLIMQRILYRLRVWGEPVIVFGAGNTGKHIVSILSEGPLTGLIPVAMFDDDPDKLGSRVAGVPVLGKINDAAAYAKEFNIQHAVIAIPSINHNVLHAITSGQDQVFTKVQFIPHMRGLPVHSVGVSNIDNYLALEFYNNLRLGRNQFFKRAIDLVGAIVGGILISPILLLLALLIKLDSRGSIVYSQKRIGRDGTPFKVLKFRSMVHNADAVLKEYLEQHPELRAEWEATHKLKDDPRITRMGRIIRKYSLDELPQLWNVVRGEMSLVGPRPIVEAEIEKYKDAFGLYCLARPGMTGYWQVSGRSDTSYDRRVELDSFYIRNWSIWLDIIILLGTLRVVSKGDGAY